MSFLWFRKVERMLDESPFKSEGEKKKSEGERCLGNLFFLSRDSKAKICKDFANSLDSIGSC